MKIVNLISAITPSTGDDSNLTLWIALLALAVVGLMVMSFISRGKKK